MHSRQIWWQCTTVQQLANSFCNVLCHINPKSIYVTVRHGLLCERPYCECLRVLTVNHCSIVGIVETFTFDLYPSHNAPIFCQYLSAEVQQLYLCQITPQSKTITDYVKGVVRSVPLDK